LEIVTKNSSAIEERIHGMVTTPEMTTAAQEHTEP
jgi:hypothetical protein